MLRTVLSALVSHTSAHLCFDANNECGVLTAAIDRYRERTGHYPERILVDQIYRNRANRGYCKKHGIRISGPALGRPRALSAEEKKQGYADNTDRIEVERGFSLAKRCYGLGLINQAGYNYPQFHRIIHPCDECELSGGGLFLRLFYLGFFKVQMAEKSAERTNIQHLCLKCCVMSRHYLLNCSPNMRQGKINRAGSEEFFHCPVCF